MLHLSLQLRKEHLLNACSRGHAVQYKLNDVQIFGRAGVDSNVAICYKNRWTIEMHYFVSIHMHQIAKKKIDRIRLQITLHGIEYSEEN